MMLDVKKETVPFSEAFEAWIRERADDPLLDARRRAFSLFATHGYPTFRDEAWKYTNLTALSKLRFEALPEAVPAISADVVDSRCYGRFPCHAMVFVDGNFVRSLSNERELPAGVKLLNLSEMGDELRDRFSPAEASPFEALNLAFMSQGAVLHVMRDTAVELPVHFVYIRTRSERPTVTYPRNLIAVGAGSKVAVVETYVSIDGGTYFTNAVTDVHLGENARVDHYKIQRESLDAFHIASLRVTAQRNSTFRSFFVSSGGHLVRNEIHAPLEAEGITCQSYGLYLTDGDQHVDCHTLIDHAKPRCTSEQIYKGMLDGKSHGVFSGTVLVRENAQKTDAHQSNKNLLLSDDALVNTRPQLQIHADDVKCTHGVAIGALDETQLFYLLSRGIGRQEARDMLTYAFASELVSKIDIPAVRRDVSRRISAELAADSEAQEEASR